MKDVSEHVVSDIGDANIHRRFVGANRPDAELHLVLLRGKDMLDSEPDLCPRFAHDIKSGMGLPSGFR
ncbi:hypothetical protein F9K94_17605 [Brucella tritici]|uniref:Uncharacterized protein n=1 Tax=Brucella tritici TaxID=94626 RepID=A0A7V7VT63_9HYPH|nr:hypothetical protein [Brucella tritici]KAB2656314.1 hypothetical protein F9K94_17605 [Brucella tritici]